MKTGVNFSNFQSTELSESLSTMNLENTDILSRREKWISLTFWSATLSKTLSPIDLQKAEIHSRRDTWFQSLLIDGVVQNIVDDWHAKVRYSFGGREVNFISFRRSDCPNHSRRLIYKRQRFLWEQRELNFSHPRSTGSSKTLSTIDLQKTDLFDEGEINEFHSLWSTRAWRSLTTMDLENTFSSDDREKWTRLTLIDEFDLIVVDDWSRKDWYIRREKGTWLFLNRHWSCEC
jgi:hypothetical protein